MHEVIIQGICYHNLTMETMNRYLLDLNQHVTDNIVGNALSYYEMYAPGTIKSYGN